MSWCEESNCQVLRDLPGILLVKDLTYSWKTRAKLPKRGRFYNFSEMPTTLDGLLKLHYSNELRRQGMTPKFIGRVVRNVVDGKPVLSDQPKFFGKKHMRKLRNKKRRAKA